jgi:predicted nuclease of predicted toxin-antitoxin system
MKFLIDAQLPPSLKELFSEKGYDCIHTRDLELGNFTPDKTINIISVTQERILITKDSDFLESFIIKNEPYKLILVKLGNTSKAGLIQFFNDNFIEMMKKIAVEDMILLSKEE